MNEEYLTETQDYVVRAAAGSYAGSPYEGKPCYQIFNRHTGVIEAEGCVLPSAITTAHYLQAQLDQARIDPAGLSQLLGQEQGPVLH